MGKDKIIKQCLTNEGQDNRTPEMYIRWQRKANKQKTPSSKQELNQLIKFNNEKSHIKGLSRPNERSLNERNME